MELRDENALEIQRSGLIGLYHRRTFSPRLQPDKLARTLTLGYWDFISATDSGVSVDSQYGENFPFRGFPDGLASMAKLRMKWKSIPSDIGTELNVTGTPVAPMYSIITLPSDHKENMNFTPKTFNSFDIL